MAYYHREEGRWPWQPKPEKKAHVSLTPSLTVRYPNRTEIIREPKKLGRTKGLSYVLDNGIQEIDFGWDIHVIVTKNGEPIETPIDFDIDADVNSDGIDIVWSESSEFPYYPENYRGGTINPGEGPWIPPDAEEDWPPTPAENFWSCNWYHVMIPVTDDDIFHAVGSGEHKISARVNVHAHTTGLPIKVEASGSDSMAKDVEVTGYGITIEIS